MYKKKKIAVVVVAYNEEKYISEVINTIPNFIDYVVVVDDCSTDNTPQLIKKNKDKRLIRIRHEKNQGVAAAVIDGHKEAMKKGVDICVVMGGDGQMQPEFLPNIIDPVIEQNYDYVKGNRFMRSKHLEKMPLHRVLGNLILTFMTKLSSGYWQIFDPQHGYTAIKTSVLKDLNLDKMRKNRFRFENDMLVNLNIGNYRVKDVPIPSKYEDPRSHNSHIRLYSFVPKTTLFLFNSFFKRIFKKYFWYNFHILSLFILAALPLLLISIIQGIIIVYNSYALIKPPTTGQILLVLLPFLVGFQLLLAALILDILNEPK